MPAARASSAGSAASGAGPAAGAELAAKVHSVAKVHLRLWFEPEKPPLLVVSQGAKEDHEASSERARLPPPSPPSLPY